MRQTKVSARRFPPSSIEIAVRICMNCDQYPFHCCLCHMQAVRNLTPLICRFYFLDGKAKAMGVNPTSTATDVIKNLAEKIELQNVEGWALYEVTVCCQLIRSEVSLVSITQSVTIFLCLIMHALPDHKFTPFTSYVGEPRKGAFYQGLWVYCRCAGTVGERQALLHDNDQVHHCISQTQLHSSSGRRRQ